MALTITGCASIDEDALAARQALLAGSTDEAVKYGTAFKTGTLKL